MALSLGELSPQVTERALQPFLSALSVLAALGHLSQRERQGTLTRYIRRCVGARAIKKDRRRAVFLICQERC